MSLKSVLIMRWRKNLNLLFCRDVPGEFFTTSHRRVRKALVKSKKMGTEKRGSTLSISEILLFQWKLSCIAEFQFCELLNFISVQSNGLEIWTKVHPRTYVYQYSSCRNTQKSHHMHFPLIWIFKLFVRKILFSNFVENKTMLFFGKSYEPQHYS